MQLYNFTSPRPIPKREREYGDRLGFEDWIGLLEDEFRTEPEQVRDEFRRFAGEDRA
jgi:hypothetical protein